MGRSDRFFPRSLGPREHEALRLIERRPGITAAELADRLDVTTNRVWQIVRRLEAGLSGASADEGRTHAGYPVGDLE
jgi:predicted ArsR family transcriptional regulator